MAFRIGIANGQRDFLFALHKFLTSYKMIDNIIYDGGNTGNGYISAEWASDESGVADDTWTIDLDSGGTGFTVTGGSYGLQTNLGTVGVPYVTDGEEVGFTLIQGLVPWASADTIDFDSTDGMTSTQKWSANRYNMVYPANIDEDPVSTNVGTGGIGAPNYDMYAEVETWTITCTNIGTPAVFSVVGSVTGAKADATAGVAYDNGFISFTITVGGVAWAVDDYMEVTIPIEREIMWQAPGNAGTEEIYMGMQTLQDLTAVEDVFQLLLQGYTGYSSDAATEFHSQPGAIQYPATPIPRCVQQDRDMMYWFVANGRRVICFYEVDTVMEAFYMGFILPYGLPTENPYPLAIGGTTDQADHDYTSENYRHRAFWDGACPSWTTGSALQIYDGAGWVQMGNWNTVYANYGTSSTVGCIWPFLHAAANEGYNNNEDDKWKLMQTETIDGSYALYPVIPWKHKPTRICFGEFEGLFAVTGVGLNSKDTTNIAGVDYLISPNVFRTDASTWGTLRLL